MNDSRSSNFLRAFIIVGFGIWLVFRLTDLPELWTREMADIVNDTSVFSDRHGHAVDGEYSVSIDLSDLDSNVGKELYNDGKHRIYVMWVDNVGVSGGGYRIGFRAVGTYSHNGASLISGQYHETLGEHEFTTKMTAKMKAEYKGNVYESATYGTSGINFKDGDDFSFYLFPVDAYESGEITLDEKGIVKLTLTGLYQNLWQRL
ncbi:hypothetical protein [Paenibacillus montanisoli]|uniref:Uncharacterized protein n=1 Tax=Paenibacillus montanisoli TaxID=2081970 RepID=A0A328U4Y7_9BACL|nr:hypothetical protein [Paenibacillus montanisoli]RAP75995.1 hypothetical protein DL346_11250 [Paenibacillus montanisoli]